MTHDELIDALSLRTGIPRDKIPWLLDRFASTIRTKLRAGGRPTLRYFGTFHVTHVQSGLTYDRHTATWHARAQRKIVKFAPHKHAKECVCGTRTP